ncbi:MAG: hypothetical protein II249_03430 [Bacteroidaceae bacterium]|nr:hypothetical protein [Bacteroidaceae bacterium]
MGQRLNIEILKSGSVLANAYYHWSGYTTTAIELAQKVLSALDKDMPTDNDRLKAVWLLQATGAGLTEDERKSIKAKDFTNLTDCNGRNEGLIAVTDKGISETRAWEEARVSIFIDEERVNFECLWKEKTYEYDDETEKYEYERPKAKELPLIGWNLDDIKFKDFHLFAELMKEMCEDKQYEFRTEYYPSYVFMMIE